MSETATLARDTISDLPLEEALRAFAGKLDGHFGDRLLGVYLFGSRARGDHQRDSDADIAVVLSDSPLPFWPSKLQLVNLAYEWTLATGVHFSPCPFSRKEWDEAASSLVQSARRDAIPI